MTYPKVLYRQGGDIFVHRGRGLYTWNDKDLKPQLCAHSEGYPYALVMNTGYFSLHPMTTKTKRPEKRSFSKTRSAAFVIDPHSPDVVSETPVAYTERRIKRGAKWAPIFFRWLKRAKVRNGRYFQLVRSTRYSAYYDILTHLIYHVYPPFKLDAKPKARRLTS